MIDSDKKYCTIDEALDELRQGKMIVLVDDENRENEGDLVAAGELISPAAINFMIRQACGRLCVSFSPGNAERLGLELLPGVNLDPSAHSFHSQLRCQVRNLNRHFRIRSLSNRSGLFGPKHEFSGSGAGQGAYGWANSPAWRRSRSCWPYRR